MSDSNPADRDRDAEAVLGYWFDYDAGDSDALRGRMKAWFSGGEEQDRQIAARFGKLADAAAAGALEHWSSTPRGRLALIILLDQLPRSLHRGTAAAFARDGAALALTLSGIELGLDRELSVIERIFFYMPLQHAESREVQARSVEVFGALAETRAPKHVEDVLRSSASFAVEHRDIIERFGRFPHRNHALNRESTDDEREFLESGGSSFGQ